MRTPPTGLQEAHLAPADEEMSCRQPVTEPEPGALIIGYGRWSESPSGPTKPVVWPEINVNCFHFIPSATRGAGEWFNSPKSTAQPSELVSYWPL